MMVEYCKKIRFKSGESEEVSVILGKIIYEDSNEVQLLTGRGRTFRIMKHYLISIEDTDREFIEE
jgi:hypothetical protein